MSFEPFVIRQKMGPNDLFTGNSPSSGPIKSKNGLIHSYPSLNSGGLFLFSQDEFMRVRRIVADFKSSTEWSISILHPDLDSGGVVTEILNHTDHGSNLIDQNFDFDLIPNERVIVTCDAVESFCEILAYLVPGSGGRC